MSMGNRGVRRVVDALLGWLLLGLRVAIELLLPGISLQKKKRKKVSSIVAAIQTRR